MMMKTDATDSSVITDGTCYIDNSNNNGELAGAGEIMLFGVRVTVDSMRKSVSMDNLSQYVHVQQPPTHDESGGVVVVAAGGVANECDVVAAGCGYASADDVVVRHSSSNGRERKRGVPWTEDEHKLFLVGLQKVGKGDWRGISRNFVKTRTPTQVASHAQKHFLRRSNLNRRRRRSSLFDMSTDAVTPVPMEEDQVNRHEKTSQQHTPMFDSCNTSKFPLVVPTLSMPFTQVGFPVPTEKPMETLTLGQGDQTKDYSTKLIRPIPITPLPVDSTPDLTLNLRSAAIDPSPLSLKLSLSTYQNQTSSRHSSAFQTMSNFNNGDGIISVA